MTDFTPFLTLLGGGIVSVGTLVVDRHFRRDELNRSFALQREKEDHAERKSMYLEWLKMSQSMGGWLTEYIVKGDAGIVRQKIDVEFRDIDVAIELNAPDAVRAAWVMHSHAIADAAKDGLSKAFAQANEKPGTDVAIYFQNELNERVRPERAELVAAMKADLSGALDS